jgi:hypothetical protein
MSGVDRSSVHRWAGAYLRCHVVADLRDLPHTGRPREADDLDAELLDTVLVQDPRTVGYQATWTTPLLATHLREKMALCSRSACCAAGCASMAGAGNARAISIRSGPRMWHRKKDDCASSETKGPQDVLLFADATRLHLFPPLRACRRLGKTQRLPPKSD